MMQARFYPSLLVMLLLVLPGFVAAQSVAGFLIHPTDARRLAMSNAGTALAPDAFSIFHNAAALPHTSERAGIGYTYAPWASAIDPHATQHSLAAFFRPTRRQAIGVGFRRFVQGASEDTDFEGNVRGFLRPKHYAVNASYALRVSAGWSVALTGTYISSDLGMGAKYTWAADFETFYRHATEVGQLSAGLQIANVGGRLDFGLGSRALPAFARIGVAYGRSFAGQHMLTATAECQGGLHRTDRKHIDGIVGVEYVYAHTLSLRGGYRVGKYNSGDGQYGTIGAGVHWKFISLDAVYLIGEAQSPLHNTWMVSAQIRY